MAQQDSQNDAAGLSAVASADAAVDQPLGLSASYSAPSEGIGKAQGSAVSANWAEVASHALLGGRHTAAQCIVRWMRLQEQFRCLNQEALARSLDLGGSATPSDGVEKNKESDSHADNASSSSDPPGPHSNKRRKLSEEVEVGSGVVSGAAAGTSTSNSGGVDLSLIESSCAGGTWSIEDVRKRAIQYYHSTHTHHMYLHRGRCGSCCGRSTFTGATGLGAARAGNVSRSR
jgi:hypothetical protein